MLPTLRNFLGIREDEQEKVFLLMGMGFFIGFLVASFSVSANALFLIKFNEQKDLPYAIIFAGLFGIFSTYVYNEFQHKVPFWLLGTGTLLFIFVILSIIQLGYWLDPDNPIIVFSSFVFAVPFVFLTALVFWGTFGRIFDLRQSKRIIGGIDTGQLTASLVALFSIPFILRFIKTEQLVTISLICSVGAVLFFGILSRRHLLHYKPPPNEKKVPIKDFFKDRYVLLMSMFIMISMVVVTFIDFAFLNATSRQFTEVQLPSFLAYFEATVVIFSFIFQTFVTDRVINQYGLKVALLVNPVLTAIFTAGAILVGSLLGVDATNDNFLFFFLVIAMSKLFVNSLKDALDGPSFKLYMLPVGSEIRHDVQTKIDGLVTATAEFIAGGLLLLISRVENFNLLLISLGTFPLMGIWFFTTTKMYARYRLALHKTLEVNKKKANLIIERLYSLDSVLGREVNHKKDSKVIFGLRLMEKLSPFSFEKSISNLIETNSKKISDFVKNKRSRFELNHIFDNTSKELVKKALKESSESDKIEVDPQRLYDLSKSLKKEERLFVARIIRNFVDDQNIFIILELIRDPDPQVRAEAIISAGKTKRKETFNLLIDLLGSQHFSHLAAASLQKMGEDVLPSLEAAFHKTGQPDLVMYRIVKIMGGIGGRQAISMLWKKLDYPDFKIVKKVLSSFQSYRYQANASEKLTLTNLLDEQIAKCFWNMKAYAEVPKGDNFNSLLIALKEELTDDLDQIYLLLSLIYDPHSIHLVRENIESETSEGIAFGMELLDIFLSQDMKGKLLPLLDDEPLEDKFNILRIIYPRDEYSESEVLKNILKRNNNLSNRWTKTCALYAIRDLDTYEVGDDLVAHLFNPDRLVRETAAWVLYNKNRKIFEKVSLRLSDSERNLLREAIRKTKNATDYFQGYNLKVEIAHFYNTISLFSKVRGTVLCDLVDKSKKLELKPGEIIDISKGFTPSIFVVAEGIGELVVGSNVVPLKKKAVFGELVSPEYMQGASLYVCQEKSILFEIAENDFCDVLSDNIDLSQALIEFKSEAEESFISDISK